MQNLEVRMIVSESGLKYCAIAKAMNISPTHLSRLLMEPLNDANEKRILAAITRLKSGSKK